MYTEKSCGVVVYRQVKGKLEFLALKSKYSGNWGFPKGHMEKGERETETALRELWEESGQKVMLLDGFRTKICYPIGYERQKKVVFFLGEALGMPVKIQEKEIAQYKWLGYNEMRKLLVLDTNRHVLEEAYAFLERKHVL